MKAIFFLKVSSLQYAFEICLPTLPHYKNVNPLYVVIWISVLFHVKAMWEQKLEECAEKFLVISYYYFLHALQTPPDKCLFCNSLEKYSVEMTDFGTECMFLQVAIKLYK